MTFDIHTATPEEVRAEARRRTELWKVGKPLSADYVHVIEPGYVAPETTITVASTDGVKPMRVPKAPTMNKTETAYSLILETRRLAGEIVSWSFGSISLLLADGVRYRPDFLVVRKVLVLEATLQRAGDHWITEIHEVKGGFVRDDARVKLLVAARQYPAFRFTLAQLIKGTWHNKEIAR